MVGCILCRGSGCKLRVCPPPAAALPVSGPEHHRRLARDLQQVTLRENLMHAVNEEKMADTAVCNP